MKIRLFSLFFLVSYLCQAQIVSDHNVINVLPPSPTAAELGKTGLVSSQMSTGEASVSIPLYTFTTPNLQLPLTLSYRSNGLRVSQVATRVGLGWSLNVGGVINRSVMGAPDDAATKLIPPADFPSTMGTTATNFVDHAMDEGYDTQPDIFTFSFPGGSGRFYVGDNNTIVKLEQNNFKITNNGFNSFTIVTPDGVEYTFGEVERSTYSNSCSGNFNRSLVKNAWYLTTIVHPDGDQIWIKYGTCEFNYQSSMDQSYVAYDHGTSQDCGNSVRASTCNYFVHNYGVYPIQIRSNASGAIRLTYQPRTDITGDVQLSTIYVVDMNVDNLTLLPEFMNSPSVKKHFGFSYYYSNASATDATYKRFFLKNIFETKSLFDETASRQYSFEYNNLDDLPSRFTTKQDYMGFYNGRNNSSLITKPDDIKWVNTFGSYGFGDRRPDWNYSVQGTLSKIIYPTGGYDVITYEPNGVYSTNITVTPNHSMSFSTPGGTMFKGSVVRYSDPFTVYHDHTAHLYATTHLQDQSMTVEAKYYYSRVEVIDQDNNVISTNMAGLEQNYTAEIALQAGNTYRFRITIFSESNCFIDFQYYNGPHLTEKEIPGVRVQKIVSNDNQGNAYTKRFYYTTLQDRTRSSGIITNDMLGNQSWFVVRTPKACGAGYSGCCYDECTYVKFSSNSYYDMPSYAGEHILYPSVLESDGEDFANGVTEHLFSTAFDANPQLIHGDLLMNGPMSNTAIVTNGGMEYNTRVYKKTANGLVLQKEVLKSLKSGTPLESEKTFYAIAVTGTNATRCMASGANTTLYDYTGITCMSYQMLSRWLYVDQETITDYDENGTHAVTRVMKYDYDNPAHQMLTRETEEFSSTNKLIKEFKYPQDIASASPAFYNQVGAATADWDGLNSLISKNIIAVPMHTTIYRNTTLLDEAVNFYRISSANNTPHLYSVYAHIYNHPFEKKLEVSAYNERGKVISQRKENDMQLSYIWDYNNRYPVAEIKNASLANIAYSSFEGDNNGGWNITAAQITSDANSVIGSKYYALTTSASITKTGLTGASFIVSYWSMNGAYTVTGTKTGWPKSLRTVTVGTQQWTLYEHAVNVTDGSVTISGTGALDELRLYPDKALMTTYTYEPFIGMLSASDGNNKQLLYDYDGLARLRMVRDEERNILKTIEYKYTVHPVESASWTPTGQTRCKPCELNAAYNYNIQQYEVKDVATGSPTLNNTVWVDDGPSISCVSAVWQNTSDPVYCQTNPQGNHTGKQVQLQRDVNPCSSTYNTTRELVVGTDETVCPLAVCTGPDKRLVNYNCETGVKVYTGSVPYQITKYKCTYHYEWSDGFISQDYEEISTINCILL